MIELMIPRVVEMDHTKDQHDTKVMYLVLMGFGQSSTQIAIRISKLEDALLIAFVTF